jgi:peptidoglycan/xylan/chitin deacetylase (PgdA/CDA1 family)
MALLGGGPTAGASARPSGRLVAITFDDLPGAGTAIAEEGPEPLRAMTLKLLRQVRQSGAPAVGFVNAGKLGEGGPRAARIGILKLWIDAGCELGNHTLSHLDLHRVDLERFEKDVLAGDSVFHELFPTRMPRVRYFRHPFLHTGRSLKVKHDLEAFLSAHGYRVAPVTIDNSDWIFARAYARALGRNDRESAQRIADAYVAYMDRKFDYFERQSVALFGREIPQILLLHASSLNADGFGRLARMARARGYRFATLARALEDEAYESRDTYVGPGGITWLHRWALSRPGGKANVLPGEPRTPEFVMRAAEVAQE